MQSQEDEDTFAAKAKSRTKFLDHRPQRAPTITEGVYRKLQAEEQYEIRTSKTLLRPFASSGLYDE